MSTWTNHASLRRSGEKFNMLTLVVQVSAGSGPTIWECLCDCGRTIQLPVALVVQEQRKSCGCLARRPWSATRRAADEAARARGYKPCPTRTKRPLLDRFYEKTTPEPNTGCLLWTGCVNQAGYGRLSLNNRPTSAARLIWTLERGPIPRGMCILHRCDTPACVNIDHLFIGTMAINMHDKCVKGRHRPGAGERHARSALTEFAVRKIREWRARGQTVRWLSSRFGVGERCIYSVISRRTWKAVA